MKKKYCIKPFFIALPIILITILLIIKWNEYGKSYKSLASWGKIKMSFSEEAYYSRRIQAIITEWQKKAGLRISNKQNNTYLILDLDNKAIWLENNGLLLTEYYLELPKNYTWKLQFTSDQSPVEFTGKTILYKKEKNMFLSGEFNFYCKAKNHIRYYNFDLNNFYIGLPPISINKRGPELPNQYDYTSFIVSEQEYNKYKESIAQNNVNQSIEKETPRQVTIEENKSRWLDIEKYLYMEIDGQIQNAGYELDSLDIGKSPNYTDVYAGIYCHGESIVHKYFHLGKGTIIALPYIKIDYLGDGIWYAKTKPHPNRKLDSDRRLNLEFLIYPQEQISRLQYRKYIEKGRKLK